MTEFPWEQEQDQDAGDAAAATSPAEPTASAPEPAMAEAAPEPEPVAPGPAGEDAQEDTNEGTMETAEQAVSEQAGNGQAAVAVKRGEAGSRPVVRKEYYAISEVSDLVGLPAHVLRYWESQFSVLNPSKNRSGNRVYQRKEIKLILLVKKLLHDDKYTVEGAKQKLDQLRRGGGLADAAARSLDDQTVAALREDLQALDELLRVEGA